MRSKKRYKSNGETNNISQYSSQALAVDWNNDNDTSAEITYFSDQIRGPKKCTRSVYTCSICKQNGHNKATCQNTTAQQEGHYAIVGGRYVVGECPYTTCNTTEPSFPDGIEI